MCTVEGDLDIVVYYHHHKNLDIHETPVDPRYTEKTLYKDDLHSGPCEVITNISNGPRCSQDLPPLSALALNLSKWAS